MRNWQTNPEAKNEFAVEGDIVWIKLTQGQETCVDLPDWTTVRAYRWCALERKNGGFYAVTNLPRAGIKSRFSRYLHQLIFGAKGPDHRDGDGLNNLRSNLRKASKSQNAANSLKREGYSSPFRGVSFRKDKGKWQARVRVERVRKHIGYFTDEQEAARAYDCAALEHFGEFAKLNFPI